MNNLTVNYLFKKLYNRDHRRDPEFFWAQWLESKGLKEKDIMKLKKIMIELDQSQIDHINNASKDTLVDILNTFVNQYKKNIQDKCDELNKFKFCWFRKLIEKQVTNSDDKELTLLKLHMQNKSYRPNLMIFDEFNKENNYSVIELFKKYWNEYNFKGEHWDSFMADWKYRLDACGYNWDDFLRTQIYLDYRFIDWASEVKLKGNIYNQWKLFKETAKERTTSYSGGEPYPWSTEDWNHARFQDRFIRNKMSLNDRIFEQIKSGKYKILVICYNKENMSNKLYSFLKDKFNITWKTKETIASDYFDIYIVTEQEVKNQFNAKFCGYRCDNIIIEDGINFPESIMNEFNYLKLKPKEEAMKFWEAMKALQEGKTIRRMLWEEGDYINVHNCERIKMNLFTDDWVIYKNSYSTSIEDLCKISYLKSSCDGSDVWSYFFNEVGEENRLIFMNIKITTKHSPEMMYKEDIVKLIHDKYEEYKKMIGA